MDYHVLTYTKNINLDRLILIQFLELNKYKKNKNKNKNKTNNNKNTTKQSKTERTNKQVNKHH
jgi:hypothetical protein